MKDCAHSLWSIRTLLVVVFPAIILTLVAATSISIWVINYVNTSNSVHDLSLTLQTEIAQRIVSKCHSQLESAPPLVNVMVSNVYNGMWNISESTPRNAAILWKYFLAFPEISWINIGSANGDYWSFERMANGTCNNYRRDASTGGTRYCYQVNQTTGLPIDNWGPVAVRANYASVARGWYTMTIAAGESWIPPIFFANGDIGMSKADILRTADNSIVGVTTVDFTLQGLNLFLRSVNISRTGKAFIAQKTGELVAASAGSVNDYVAKGIMTPATNSSDPTISAVSTQLLAEFGTYGNMFSGTQPIPTVMTVNGQLYLVKIVDFPFAKNLDWFIVVIVPEEDVLNTVQQLTITAMSITAAVMVTSLVVTLLFTISLGCCISRPLSNVSAHMQGAFELDFGKKQLHSYSTLYEFTEISSALKQLKQGVLQLDSITPSALLHSCGISQYGDITRGLLANENWTVLYLSMKNLPQVYHKHNASASNLFAMFNTQMVRIAPVLKAHMCLFSVYHAGGLCAVFSNVPMGLYAALEIHQLMLSEAPLAISVHTGPVFVGCVGEETQFSPLLASPTVMMAKFMTALGCSKNTSVLVSRDVLDLYRGELTVYERLVDEFLFEEMGNAKLTVLEVLNNCAKKLETHEDYSRAIKSLEGDSFYQETMSHLQKVVYADPNDLVAIAKLEEVKQIIITNQQTMFDLPLYDVLSEKVLYDSFHTMCKAEFTIENLNAYEAVLNMMSLNDLQERKRYFRQFYDLYISNEGKFTINVQDKLRQQAESLLANPELLEDSQNMDFLCNEIRFLLFDPYKRYKSTTLFQEAFLKSKKKTSMRPKTVPLHDPWCCL